MCSKKNYKQVIFRRNGFSRRFSCCRLPQQKEFLITSFVMCMVNGSTSRNRHELWLFHALDVTSPSGLRALKCRGCGPLAKPGADRTLPVQGHSLCFTDIRLFKPHSPTNPMLTESNPMLTERTVSASGLW